MRDEGACLQGSGPASGVIANWFIQLTGSASPFITDSQLYIMAHHL